MRFLTRSLDELGFRWAYRVVDTRAFGLPQRRQRVLLLASREHDPREILFSEDAGVRDDETPEGLACGFYWTEGVRGLGWAVDAVPTLKGGSTIGIPSPLRSGCRTGASSCPTFVTPSGSRASPPTGQLLRTATDRRRSNGPRWKLVGNAVSVPVAEWLGQRLRDPRPYDGADDVELGDGDRWPLAAWGGDGAAWQVDMSPWPLHRPRHHLAEFLAHGPTLLSPRATAGFLSRTRRSRLRFPDGFIESLEHHLQRVASLSSAA